MNICICSGAVGAVEALVLWRMLTTAKPVSERCWVHCKLRLVIVITGVNWGGLERTLVPE